MHDHRYAANGTCDVSLGFQPTLPGLRLGSLVIYDGMQCSRSNHTGNWNGTWSTALFRIRGADSDQFSTTTAFNGPSAVAVDGTGNLFIADAFNNRIVEQPVCWSAEERRYGLCLSRLAWRWTGQETSTSPMQVWSFKDSEPTWNVELDEPDQAEHYRRREVPDELSFDKSGNLYIADSLNNRIMKLSRTEWRPGSGQPDVHRDGVDLSGRRGGGWSGQHLSSPTQASRLIQRTISSAALWRSRRPILRAADTRSAGEFAFVTWQ